MSLKSLIGGHQLERYFHVCFLKWALYDTSSYLHSSIRPHLSTTSCDTSVSYAQIGNIPAFLWSSLCFLSLLIQLNHSPVHCNLHYNLHCTLFHTCTFLLLVMNSRLYCCPLNSIAYVAISSRKVAPNYIRM